MARMDCNWVLGGTSGYVSGPLLAINLIGFCRESLPVSVGHLLVRLIHAVQCTVQVHAAVQLYTDMEVKHLHLFTCIVQLQVNIPCLCVCLGACLGAQVAHAVDDRTVCVCVCVCVCEILQNIKIQRNGFEGISSSP